MVVVWRWWCWGGGGGGGVRSLSMHVLEAVLLGEDCPAPRVGACTGVHHVVGGSSSTCTNSLLLQGQGWRGVP